MAFSIIPVKTIPHYDGGWKTIDSAPKHGADILAYAQDCYGYACITTVYWDNGWRLCEFNSSDEGNGWSETPTHWMPLPSSPFE